jgi:hypothetical protein
VIKPLLNSANNFLYQKVSIAPLIIFRIIFGALLLFGALRFVSKGWVEQLYILPKFHFGYLGFEWVQKLPGNWMYLPFIIMIITAVMIIVGYFYRFAITLFFLCFTYVELIDKSYYLNHYYFVSLMCFILIWLPANRYFSLDVLRNKSIEQQHIAQWTIRLIQFQLGVVYFFAGIAKLNSDWLIEGQPLGIWLQAHHNIPFIGPLLQEKWVAIAFSWAGCLYDLFIVFFLLTARTRKFAYLFVVFFHLVTWYLFPIGVFPWVMIFSTLIFFSPEFHVTVLSRIQQLFRKDKVSLLSTVPETTFRSRRLVTMTLSIYILIQLLVPFRYVLYPGNLYWTEEGFRFSWRVMLMHKEGYALFYLKDKKTGRQSEINNAKFLTRTQEDQMATQPDMILQYAQFLKAHYQGQVLHYGDQKFTIEDPAIHAEIYVSLNNRLSQKFVDKKHDLTTFGYNLKHREWVEPFNE